MGDALGAAVLARHVPDGIIGPGGAPLSGWRHFGIVADGSGRLLPLRRAALLHADLLVERVLQLVRGALEFGETFTQGLSELRQLPAPENDERERENDDQFWDADGA